MQAHFFTVPTDFIDDFKEAIVFISQPTSQVEAFRSLCLQEFEVAAERLFPDKVSEEVNTISDETLRNFMFRGVEAHEGSKVRSVCHMRLWKFVYERSGSRDPIFFGGHEVRFFVLQ